MLKCCTHYGSKFGKLSSGHRPKKISFNSNPKKRQCQRMFKLRHSCTIWHTSKVMLKSLQASLQQYLKCELPEVQLVLRKSRGTRDQTANIHLEHQKNKRVPEKHLLLFYWLRQSRWLWITTDCGKFFKRWEYQITLPVSWEICMWTKKQQLELDMEQQIVSKLGKEYVKAVCCHPAYLTYLQSTSCKMQD